MPSNGAARGSPSSRDTGSQRALRELNTQKLLQSLLQQGPQTQAELARLTGLSAGTISNIVKELLAEGRVSTSSVIVSGRRSTRVRLAADERVVIGMDIGRSHIRMAISNPAQKVLGTRFARLPLGHLPEDTLRLGAGMVDEMLSECGIARTRVKMCGIALPASLDPQTGEVVQASVLPRWAGYDLGRLSVATLGFPTILENDANLGALAHLTFGRHQGVRNLVYVKVATGIGVGLAFGGRIFESSTGLTGEIGHFQVAEGGAVCYCGNRGCLETLASTRRIISDLDAIRPGQNLSIDDVIEASRANDPAVLRILEEAGTAIGKALAMVCNLISPDVVVLGGPLTLVADSLLHAVEHSARIRALPSAMSAATFMLSELNDDAETLGACALALQQISSSALPENKIG